MTDHAHHRMHSNSLEAWEAEREAISGRHLEVYGYMLKSNEPQSDRQIAKGLGYDHRSAVQPRISDLVNWGWLLEVDTIVESDSGKPRSVRRVRAVTVEERMRKAAPAVVQDELVLVP